MDIIMFASARWDGPYSSSAYCLAKELSKKNRVFYIDNPITLKYFFFNFNSDHIKRRRKALLTGRDIYTNAGTNTDLTIVTPRVILPLNFLPTGLFYNMASAFNDRILHRALRQLLVDHHISNFIFINSFNPFYIQSFPPFFKPKLFIYISVDDISQSRHVDKHGPRMEAEIIKKADLTLVTSSELKQIHSKISNRVFLLPNAADVSMFRKSMSDLPKPAEISAIEKPIIIYTGNIEDRIDYNLLKYIAEHHKDKILLMVGPVSIQSELINSIRKMENVIFTRRKNIDELPSYLKYASCAIIPFKCNVLTKSIYPLKINEYLASGKPVVATPFSADIKDFEKVIYLAKDYDSFSKAIDVAMLEDSQEHKVLRSSFVEKNTWENRVETFWEIISNHIRT